MPNPTFLCIASYLKGQEVMRTLKKEGCTVYLLTSQKLKAEPWGYENIDESFYVPQDADNNWNMQHVIAGLAHTMRSRKIDRIIALDDFDVEKAAELREHFRIPGMGQTTGRFFRDKLAMRQQAQDTGLQVPPFSALFNDIDITNYLDAHQPPFVIKPRGEASATGIKKVHNKHDAWQTIHALGERRHEYLIEQFKAGDVFHVDALTVEKKVVFARASQYLSTPMEVAHEGGVFRTHTIELNSEDDIALKKFNEAVLKAFNLQYSASHTEFIKAKEDGAFYFLETASRVGGAHTAELVEAAANVNLWREWARLEVAVAQKKRYKLPVIKEEYAGTLISLAKQPHPDTSDYTDKEIFLRMNMEYHVGFIVQSASRERVLELLDGYLPRVYADFHAAAPLPDKPTH
jgi:biotin carboxylase